MEKNTASKWVVFAFEDEGGTNPGEPVTGDAANITANVRIDGGAANAVDDTNPTELEDGYYIFDITATEANGDLVLMAPQSSTANVNVIGVPGAVWTTPPAFNDNELATSAQVDNIGAASGGAINFAPIEDNTGGAIDPSSALFVGSVVSGTFASVGPGTSTSHSIDDTANDIDIVYGYQVGGGRQATNIIVNADVDGGADQISVKVYDHVGTAWDTVGEIDDNTILNIPIVAKHTGTGGELGKVYVRFETDSTTPSNLEVFESLVSAVQTNITIGYEGGAVWLDTSASNTNTESYVDGTADNPVSTIAAAWTIADNLNLKVIHALPGSSFTLTAVDWSNFEFLGQQYTMTLNARDLSGVTIYNATIVGNDDGNNSTPTTYVGCTMGDNTLGVHKLVNCGLSGATTGITLAEAGTYDWDQCFSRVAGTSTPLVTFGTTNQNLNMRHWSGGIQVENMGAGASTDNMSIEGFGQLVEGTTTAGTVAMRGNFTVSGITNLTLSDDARIDVAQINSEADTALSDIGLQYLVNSALPTSWAADVTANSALDQMADDGTAVYDRTTDSLQAIADSGGGGPTAAQIADAVWDEPKADHTTVTSFGDLATDLDAVPTATENADELLKRDWTAVSGEAARSVLNALRFLRNKWSISGTTLTVTEEDDSTSAWTSTLTENASANPVTGSDPT